MCLYTLTQASRAHECASSAVFCNCVIILLVLWSFYCLSPFFNVFTSSLSLNLQQFFGEGHVYLLQANKHKIFCKSGKHLYNQFYNKTIQYNEQQYNQSPQSIQSITYTINFSLQGVIFLVCTVNALLPCCVADVPPCHQRALL